MTQLNMIFGALFRPRATFARLVEGVKWAWLPALVLLLAAALAETAVSVPLEFKASEAWNRAQMEKQGGGSEVIMPATSEMPPEERAKIEAEAQQAAASGGTGEEVEVIQGEAPADEGGSTLLMTVGLVFSAVGVLAGLLATATFFFVAAKVWAKPGPYGRFLSMAALAFVPLAVRDLLQTAYQAVTGTWIRHQGISSLVAGKDLAPTQPVGTLYGLLQQVDVWSIWTLVLLFVGVSVVAGLERKRAVTVMVIFTVLTVIMRTAPQTVGAMFASGF